MVGWVVELQQLDVWLPVAQGKDMAGFQSGARPGYR